MEIGITPMIIRYTSMNWTTLQIIACTDVLRKSDCAIPIAAIMASANGGVIWPSETNSTGIMAAMTMGSAPYPDSMDT